MDPNINYVPFTRFQEIIAESGLPWEEKSGYIKVTGPTGGKVYVARTQRVGRVDISGFEMPPSFRRAVALSEDERFGNVTQQLDFSGTEDETLEAFVSVLEHMARLPADQVRARQPRGTEPGQQAQGGRRRLGRPSMTTTPPEGPSAQELRAQARAKVPTPPAPRTRRESARQPRARR